MSNKAKAVVRLGYPCMNLSLADCKTRTVTQTTMQGVKDKEKAFDRLLEIGKHNLLNLSRTLDWNYLNRITFFRIYSDLFPHMSNKNLSSFIGDKRTKDYQNLEPFKEEIKRIGKKIFEYGIRVTFHPNEYSCLGSPTEEVVAMAVQDIKWQALMIDLLENADPAKKEAYKNHFKDSVLIMHGGGQYGDKKATLTRWAKVYNDLPEFIRKRLVIENDERNYSPFDLLSFSEDNLIPVVIDFFHQECYELIHPNEPTVKNWSYILDRTVPVWHKRNMIPKYHVSEQQPDRRIGTHSHFAHKIPDALLKRQLDFPNQPFDIMLECKMKDLALTKCRNLHPDLETLDSKRDDKAVTELIKKMNGGKYPDLSELSEKEKGALVEGHSHSVKATHVYKKQASKAKKATAEDDENFDAKPDCCGDDDAQDVKPKRERSRASRSVKTREWQLSTPKS